MASSAPSGLEDVFIWTASIASSLIIVDRPGQVEVAMWKHVTESGPAVAHNGVRGDNDVDERVARKQPNHQSDEEEET